MRRQRIPVATQREAQGPRTYPAIAEPNKVHRYLPDPRRYMGLIHTENMGTHPL